MKLYFVFCVEADAVDVCSKLFGIKLMDFFLYDDFKNSIFNFGNF